MSQGYFYQKLLEKNPQAVEFLIGVEEAAALEAVALEKRSRVAAEIININQIISDPNKRSLLISLLPEEKKEELCERLAINTPLSAADFDQPLKKKLLEFLGVVAEERAPLIKVSSIEEVAPSYGMFDYQYDAARRVLSILDGVTPSVLLHLPTGAGKTRTAMHIVSKHISLKRPTLVLWLASSRELLEQATYEFTRAWKSIGDVPVQIVRWFGRENPDINNVSHGVVVAGLQKLHRFASNNMKDFRELAEQKISLVVFDEAHQAVASTYSDLVYVLKSHDCGLLGLSATPGRTSGYSEKDRDLALLFDEQKVMIEIEGGENPVEYLMRGGFLAKPAFRTISFDCKERYSEEDSDEYSSDLLNTVGADIERNKVVFNEIQRLAAYHRRIIIFASSIFQMRMITATLKADDFNAESISATTPKDERERIIERYSSHSSCSGSDDTMILCNYGVLTAGFDAPATSAAVIARPTKSLVLYSQMVGRAIRGPRGGGNESAEIVTVVDANLYGFGNVAEAFTNWEGIWR